MRDMISPNAAETGNGDGREGEAWNWGAQHSETWLPGCFARAVPVVYLFGEGLRGHGIDRIVKSVDWLFEMDKPIDHRPLRRVRPG